MSILVVSSCKNKTKLLLATSFMIISAQKSILSSTWADELDLFNTQYYLRNSHYFKCKCRMG